MSTKEYTVKCKKCGHELPVDAAFCDKCGEPVTKITHKEVSAKANKRRELMKPIIITVIGCALVALVFIISAYNSRQSGDADDYNESPDQQFANMESRITPEQYEQLEFGMTYDEVTALLGEEGTHRYGRVYIWPGEYSGDTPEYYGYNSTMLTLEFSDHNHLIEIKELNIIDGREIYEIPEEDRMVSVVVNEEMFSSMKNRMSYRQIADILGAEGALTESESDKSGFERKTYAWKYVMEGSENSYERILSINFYKDKAERNSWDEWGAS